MTAVLTPHLALQSQNLPLDPERASRDASGFDALMSGALLSGALPQEPPVAHPPVPAAIEAELTPRARLGVWPTQPGRSSPPQRNDSTTSSAPAGPEDGPSGQPLTMQNAPDLQAFEAPPTFLGPRLGMPGSDAFDAPQLAQDPLSPTATFEGLVQEIREPGEPRRGAEPLLRGLDGLLADAPSDVDADPAMFRDPFEAAADFEELGDGAEATDGMELWEDLLISRTDEDGIRVEFDLDLAVEVRAMRGEVDVLVDGTRDALDEIGDIQVDLEQTLADGGEHTLGRYTTQRRDPTARPQAARNLAESENTPAVQQRRFAPGGRLFNGIA